MLDQVGGFPSLLLTRPLGDNARWFEAWVSFFTRTAHQVQTEVRRHGATDGYGSFANWGCTGTILLLWENWGCLRWEVGKPRTRPRPINDPSIQAMMCHKNEFHIYPPPAMIDTRT